MTAPIPDGLTEPEMTQLIEFCTTPEGQASVLAFIFQKVSQIDSTLGVLTKALGAMSGRMGLSGNELERILRP